MFSAFGQFAATSQFYLYGRNHCTRTGWEKAVKGYPKPDILEDPNLSLEGKVYLITGANAGIGRELSQFLASKGGIIYMICRNPQRAEAARDEIIKLTNNNKVHLLLGDCSLESDIRRLWSEFQSHQQEYYPSLSPRLDALVCNAGALSNTRTLTSEGVEVTFAAHLLFGTYLLGQLTLPLLAVTDSSRLIVVSSGGMYNTKFPDWETASSIGAAAAKYDGQFAYAYAKRGQVLLVERWAALEQYRDKVKIVSCHPGWTLTEGVDAAYGENKRYLEPLRSTWQGTEGIAWLVIADTKNIQSGAFYLDRAPQTKHIAGPFFTEGSYTKNSPDEVQEMMNKLEQWSAKETRPSKEQLERITRLALPLTAMNKPIDLQGFMGQWHVLANIPTPFEVNASNCIEHYALSSPSAGSSAGASSSTVQITFTYTAKGAAEPSQSKMRATVPIAPQLNTHWQIDPSIFGLHLPLHLNYLLLDTGSIEDSPDSEYAVVGMTDRSYLWIMIRDRPAASSALGVSALDFYGIQLEGADQGLGEKKTAAAEASQEESKREKERKVLQHVLPLVEDLGYDPRKVVRVPWTATSSK